MELETSWWYSGENLLVCQCRGHRVQLLIGEIPHTVEQLNPCPTTTRSRAVTALDPGAATCKDCAPSPCSLTGESATVRTRTNKRSPNLPHLGKPAPAQQKPAPVKKWINLKGII